MDTETAIAALDNVGSSAAEAAADALRVAIKSAVLTNMVLDTVVHLFFSVEGHAVRVDFRDEYAVVHGFDGRVYTLSYRTDIQTSRISKRLFADTLRRCVHSQNIRVHG